MSFYALVTVEIQNHLWITANEVKQVWLADDATGAGSLASLKKWWINIIEEGVVIDIMLMKVNPGLFSKTRHCWKNRRLFSDSKINVTREGKRHLGAVIGSNDFRTKYASEKVTEWCNELKISSEFAKSQPQALMQHFDLNRTNLAAFYKAYQKSMI